MKIMRERKRESIGNYADKKMGERMTGKNRKERERERERERGAVIELHHH